MLEDMLRSRDTTWKDVAWWIAVGVIAIGASLLVVAGVVHILELL